MKVRTVKQLVVLASILAPLGLGGQEFSAPLLAAGQLRFEISSLFLFADERFGRRMEGGSLIEENEPLGFDLAIAGNLGAVEQGDGTGNPRHR